MNIRGRVQFYERVPREVAEIVGKLVTYSSALGRFLCCFRCWVSDGHLKDYALLFYSLSL